MIYATKKSNESFKIMTCARREREGGWPSMKTSSNFMFLFLKTIKYYDADITTLNKKIIPVLNIKKFLLCN